jgi:hypothetical protein
MKLLMVRAIKDGFMEDGLQFCAKDKNYEVIEASKNDFYILDDDGERHCFVYDDCEWFELYYV